MKKRFNKFLTLLAVLLLGFGQMWGADQTISLVGATVKSATNKTAADFSAVSSLSVGSGEQLTSLTVGRSAATGVIFSSYDNKSNAMGTSTTYYLVHPYNNGSKVKWSQSGDNLFYADFVIPDGCSYTISSIDYGFATNSAAFSVIIGVKDITSTPEDEYTSSSIAVGSGSTAVSSISSLNVKLEAGTHRLYVIPSTTATNTGKYWGMSKVTLHGEYNSGSSTPVAVTGITLAPSAATIKVGKKVTLVPTITPSDATDKAVTWAVTSGNSYASVTSGGVVEGLAVGTAVVTATAHDGSGVTQTATITVEECPTSGTIFSMNITAAEGTAYAGNNTFPALIGATYVGGAAYSGSKSTTNRTSTIDANGEYPFSAHSELAIKVEMDCPFEEGDIITITNTSNTQVKIQKVVGTDLYKTASKTFTIPSGSPLIDEDVFYIMRDNQSSTLASFTVTRPLYRTITLEYADGVTPDGSLQVIDGTAATKPTDPTWEHHRFDGWYNGASPYDWTATVSGDLTLTAHWTQLYTVTYAKGDEGATGDAPTQADKAATETFKVAANTFELAGKVFDHWNDGANDYDPEDTYTVGTSNVTLTAVWRTPSTMYAIAKGDHDNGDFTISPAEQEAGGTVTLVATPDEDYLFDAWEVVKTEDASATGITVDANGQFEMPAYGVTVNATFVADPRQKVLYISTASTENDKVYEALKDIYNVKVVSDPASTIDQSAFALVVLHESVGGGNYNATAIAAAKTGDVPVLNTKSFFYTNARWNWGTPNAGKKTAGVHVNRAYCNITDHPLFAGLTPDANDSIIILSAINTDNKPIQPVGSFTSGKEGYTLANVPDGCAIHELTPAQRGASAGKYLLISLYSKDFANLNADGQKLFQNAAAYLIGSTAWEPIAVPTAAVIEAAPSAAYSVGDNIALSALAAGVSAATTYTWYKGDTWAEAETAGAIQAAKTAADSGDSFGITGCALGDEGTYWCVISNGTDCEAKASLAVTVTDASYNITFVSAHGTAPTATTGVSYTLPTLTESGWAHQGWTANIDVTVDEAVVATGTTIANGKTAIFSADVTFTAVWKQIFAVTFNLNGQSGSIAQQDIIDGEKATKPDDPVVIGQDFGGWFTDAACTAGNEFDFNTAITEAKELFAKWTEFDGCTLLVPATSGENAGVGDAIVMQTGSKGATMTALAIPDGGSLAYTANGLAFNKKSGVKTNVVLNNDMKVGTKISLKLVAGGDKTRGLFLYTKTGTKIEAFTCWVEGVNPAVENEEETFTYTVVADDGLEGTNEFQLWRNNTVYLKQLAVTECGAAVVYHNLTSAVDPAGKGTVTLDASSVREGLTTKATYSDIDPLYEFVNWTVSGAGASIDNATANPVTVTMGTEDAVITLNLQVKPVYYTVTYMDGTTEMGTEEVAENGHPTAAGIATAKKGSTFLGWSEINGGAVVDLADITITTAKTIYAKYEAIACPVSGTVFSMTVTDPEDTEYNENNEFGLEIGATYTGGKAYSGSKSSTKRIGKIDENGEYSFNSNGDVTVKIDLDCALQEGDVITFTSTPSRELKIQKVAGTDLYTTSSKTFTIPAASSLIGEYEIYLMRGNSESTFKTFNVYRPAVLTGVTLADAVVAIDGKVTPVMTLAPAPDAYISSQVWSIEGAGEGTIATINTETGEVTGKAIGSVTVKVVLNGSIENTCTVTVIDSYTQVAVTETSEWNFAGAAAASSKINFPNSTEEFLLANISGVNNTPEFNSRALVVKGKYVSNSQLQAQTIRFNVTTSGKLTIRYACTSNKGEGNNRELYINGVATGSMTYNDEVTYSQVVPGGEVTIKALYDKESVLTEDIMNYKYIKFDVTPDVSDADYTRDVTEGRYGTICLPNGGVMVGAEIFTLAYYGATSQKFFFDEIASAEMEAGKPYLFFPHEGATQLGVYYTDAAGEAAKTVNGFVGFIGADADDYTQVPANDNCYIISNNLYRQVQTGAVAYILSNRAYIDMTSVTNIEPAKAPGARRIGLGVQGKDQAQGFENIETGDAPMKVMINGTMYILRGEKVYDATGRLVK